MDNNLLNLFFTITAAAVIVVTILLVVLIVYIIIIVRAIKRTVKTAEFAAELIKDGAADLRESIGRKGFTTGVLAGFLRSLRRRAVTKKK